MKLRSGKVCQIMDSNLQASEILNAVTVLNDLYKLGESKMASRENFELVNDVLHKVNLSYTTFSSVCSHLNSDDIIPGTSVTKLAFDTGYNEFKERVQQWLENWLKDEYRNSYPRSQTAPSSVPISQYSKVSPAIPTVPGPTISKPYNPRPVAQSHDPVLPRREDAVPGLDRIKNEQTTSKLVNLPIASKPVSSRRSSNYSSASRLAEARIKLEMAKLTKQQNEERLKEEMAEAKLKMEMERQKMEMERQKAEMDRLKIMAEDERRIKAAELEAALLQGSEDSSSHRSQPMAKRCIPSVDGQCDKGQKLKIVPNISAPIFETATQQNKADTCQNYVNRLPQNIPECNFVGNQPMYQSRHVHTIPKMLPDTNCLDPSKPEDAGYKHVPINPLKHKVQQEAERDFNVLPKPIIQTFTGDPLDFWAFYNRLESHLPNWLPAKRKISYLLQHCSTNVCQSIQHYADLHDGENAYHLAWKELKRRYGQTHIIAQTCEEQLLKFPKLDKDVSEKLNKLSILMKRCRSAMADETVTSGLDSVQFLTTIASKFSLDLKRKWVERSTKITDQTGRIASFVNLADFVEEQALVANSVFGLKLFNQTPLKYEQSKGTKISTFQTATNLSKAKSCDKCLCCSGLHKIYQCREFREMSLASKWQIVRKYRLCKLCLNPGHFAHQCTLKICCKKENCGSANHNSLLHHASGDANSNDKGYNHNEESETQEIKSLATLSKGSSQTSNSRVYLDIVPVKVVVEDSNIVVQTYALLDSGSDKTFCEKRLAEQFNLESSPVKLAMQTLTPGAPHVMNTKVVSFNLSSLDSSYSINLPEVVVVDSIPVAPTVIPSNDKLSKYPHLRGIDLHVIENGSVTMLIGNDCAAAHRCLDNRFSPDPGDSPDAVLTPFGWTLRGSLLTSASTTESATNFLIRGLKWPIDVQELDDMILTDEGEMFSSHPGTDFCDKEALLKMLQDQHEILEFGLHYSLEDPIAYDIMTRHLKYVDGHFQLPLLWKNDAVKLPASRDMALKRLECLKKRLIKNSGLHEKYSLQMQKMIDAGYAVKVPHEEVTTSHREWYIPHQPILNANKPGKVRIVHDCAATVCNKSLNDFLMKGPDLVNSLVGVLLRFRKDKIAVTADIEAMFYQVRVAPRDQDALRFFWWPEGNLNNFPRVYRMAVHLFGAKSSPSCASFCLRQTAKEFGKYFDPAVTDLVLYNFYVDDCLFSVENEDKAINILKKLKSLLKKGGFNLTKWLSNSPKVLNSIPEEEKSPVTGIPMPTAGLCQRVLGLNWDVDTDSFYVNVDVPDAPLTKRGILSVTNSLYDPLGFIAPVVLKARLIYSEVCKQKLEWDDEIETKEVRKWKLWLKSLMILRNVKIDRYFQVTNPVQIQLHFFSDASNVARGAVCYIRCLVTDRQAVCRIVMAKAHVENSTKKTIPRMELEAALDSVVLGRVVKQELGLQVPCFYWTDSMIVLRSLHADTKRFPLFSHNRLQRILKHTKVYDWNYVPSKENPADHVSRGMTAEELLNTDIWFRGPSFLASDAEDWPKVPDEVDASDEVYSGYNLNRNAADISNPVTATNFVCQVRRDLDPLVEFIQAYSDLNRLKIAASWILRFKMYLSQMQKRQTEVPKSLIGMDELKNTELYLIKYVQSCVYKDEMYLLEQGRLVNRVSRLYKLNPILVQGILRVGGRLDNAVLDYDLKHPIILPDMNHLTTLIIRDAHAHSAGHCGVRITLNILCQRFWILNAKVAVRRVIGNCVTCKRIRTQPQNQLMANLPEARFQINQPPFSHVGVDYFGPLITKVKRSHVKRYGAIFTCMTVRAIHLELAYDLTTSSFINVLRRFLSRRGPVTHIYSDNGTNFVSSAKILKDSVVQWNQVQIHKFLRKKQVEWSFNAPSASHTGGVWERLIRSVREVLLAVMPKDTLTDDELHTLLLEIEAIVNSRPLTELPLEVGQKLPLTPNHLLRINSDLAPSPLGTEDTNCYSRQRFRVVQHVADNFWKRWIVEYPKTLLTRSKWFVSRRNLSPGDIVLIVDSSLPRGRWPLGRITKVFPDSQQLVRTVLVKTESGVIRRPSCKICLILPSASSENT